MSKEYKINCGFKPLKDDERRGSMEECIKKSQIRYFGLHKINPSLMEDYILSKKNITDANRFKYSIGRMQGLKARGEKIKKYIKSAKLRKDKEKEEKYTKELEEIRKELKKCLPIALKRYKEENIRKEREKKEKEQLNKLREQQLNEERKKNKNKSKKKTSKK
jgi:hypothetical protein